LHILPVAHLFYFVIKDHPFLDGNKRIGSFLFLLYNRQEGIPESEKGEMITLFGKGYRRYTGKTPMFMPGFGGKHNGKNYIEC